MKWRNGTEYSDTHAADLHWRHAGNKKPLHPVQHIALGQLVVSREQSVITIQLNDVEYLDESDPSLTTDDETKLQEEAERRYPYSSTKATGEWTDDELCQLERQSYKEGRRKSISTLKEKEKEIEALRAWIAEARELIDDFWCAVPTDSDWCQDMQKILETCPVPQPEPPTTN